MKVSILKNNPNNPRVIKDDKLKKLIKSIQDFPEMMEKRPMVCVTDTDGKIFPLGGNMRLRAIREIGMKEIPDSWVQMADEWTEEQRLEFVIKDNASMGEWNFSELSEGWNIDDLEQWGVNVPLDENIVGSEIRASEAFGLSVAENLNPKKHYIVVTFESQSEYDRFIIDKNIPMMIANKNMKASKSDINYQKVFKYEDLHTII